MSVTFEHLQYILRPWRHMKCFVFFFNSEDVCENNPIYCYYECCKALFVLSISISLSVCQSLSVPIKSLLSLPVFIIFIRLLLSSYTSGCPSNCLIYRVWSFQGLTTAEHLQLWLALNKRGGVGEAERWFIPSVKYEAEGNRWKCRSDRCIGMLLRKTITHWLMCWKFNICTKTMLAFLPFHPHLCVCVSPLPSNISSLLSLTYLVVLSRGAQLRFSLSPPGGFSPFSQNLIQACSFLLAAWHWQMAARRSHWWAIAPTDAVNLIWIRGETWC